HDTCDTVGVIAPVVSIIASLQVVEVLKYLTGNEGALSPGLTTLDVWANEFRTVPFPPRSRDCRCCGERKFTHLEAAADALTVSLCGRRTVQVRPPAPPSVSLGEIAKRLAQVGRVQQNPYLLRCDLGEEVITLFADGRALIHGTDDEARARSVYARYIGM
ncbi:MAG: thiazole biosynthesis adenylyltransferase ThiF, partial [Alicyclobacillaceae bacterium]|nr:thiazole biosynthesis adenylyltransferase ThiF [Alicyclobacillaceae bacterium]